MLTGNKGLAKISATPGKTQLINHFGITSASTPLRKDRGEIKWYLVDLPGYGYASVSQKARNNWENMIESYIRKRENLVCLFVLIDSRHEPQASDLEFINKLGEWQIPFSLVFTKTDKNKPVVTERNIKMFLSEMLKTWETVPPFFITSATEKKGKAELLDYIKDMNNKFSTN